VTDIYSNLFFGRCSVRMRSVTRACLVSLSAKFSVSWQAKEVEWDPILGQSVLDPLLDLIAGAGEDTPIINIGNIIDIDMADEAEVNVNEVLLLSMEHEVQSFTLALEKCPRVRGKKNLACPFCPFRTFAAGHGKGRFVTHLQRHHARSKMFIASGTKQLRFACCPIQL
jgi:hypothetical protein